jgi:protein-S-isoprenylcysteine O-methyltransferase Ste14
VRLLIRPPATLLMSSIVMLVLNFSVPMLHIVPQPVNWLGALLIAAGLAVSAWHSRMFERLETNIDTFGEPGRLTREGMFSRTRNPMYLGFLAALTGLAVVLGSLSPIAILLVFFAMTQFWYIPTEERAMSRKFGDEYAEYQLAVPRWL